MDFQKILTFFRKKQVAVDNITIKKCLHAYKSGHPIDARMVWYYFQRVNRLVK